MAAALVLRNGSRMPCIGLGTYTATAEAVSAAVDCALTIGYRHIDTAALYNNEAAIGNALRDHLKSGKLKRKDIFLTSKLPPTSFHSEKAMQLEMEQTLHNLQLSHVDMYLLHHPWAFTRKKNGNEPRQDSSDIMTPWRMMENFYSEGKVKGIGLSNFSIRLITKILSASKVPPINLQLECHPYLQQRNLRNFCAENQITITAYAPLGSGGRSDIYKRGEPSVLNEEKVLKIAGELKSTPAQVLIAYIMHQNMVPLPKSAKPARIEENFKAVNLKLTNSHIETLNTLEKGVKYFDFVWAKGHSEYIEGEEY